MKDIINYLWNSTKNYRRYYLLMICAPILAAFYKPVVFYSLKLIVDDISTNKSLNYSELIRPVLIYLLIDISVSSIWRISEVASYKSEPQVKRNIILSSVERILSFHYSFFQNISSGIITSKIKGILDGYSNIWGQIYYGISFAFLGAVTIICSIFAVNIILGSILLIWSVIYIGCNYRFTKKINELSEIQGSAKHKIIGDVSDNITNALVIKSFSSRKIEQERLDKTISNDYIPKQIALAKLQILVNIFNDIMGLAIILIMIFIMFYLRKHQLISIGSFVFIFGLSVQFQESLWRLMQQIHLLSDQVGDFKSAISISNADSSEYNNQTRIIDNKSYNINFHNVSFSYTADHNIFNNLNLTIQHGDKVGIIGYTGAGKTTLINLLTKNFKPQNGIITINNIDINALDSDYLRSLITVVPQDISLFHRSIIENIRHAKVSATDDEVYQAAQSAYAHEFITKLPQGYDTIVGERGLKLSGGQRQRIAIARAILKDAPILILDEATSALDNMTEEEIRKSINSIIKNKTVIAIAHRVTTLKNMNRLIVLDKGVIVKDGGIEILDNYL